MYASDKTRARAKHPGGRTARPQLLSRSAEGAVSRRARRVWSKDASQTGSKGEHGPPISSCTWDEIDRVAPGGR
jgi:hypothetical protein